MAHQVGIPLKVLRVEWLLMEEESSRSVFLFPFRRDHRKKKNFMEEEKKINPNSEEGSK